MPPKSRVARRVTKAAFGKISDRMVLRLVTTTTKYVQVKMYHEGEVDEDGDFIHHESGHSYILQITVPGRMRPLWWDITGMTGAEFEATRQFFNHLFDLAEPIIRERDRIAQNALAEGNDSYERSYRNLPQLLVREGSIGEHREGVRQRSPNILGGSGDGGDSIDRVSRDGDELADGEYSEARSQDNGSSSG